MKTLTFATFGITLLYLCGMNTASAFKNSTPSNKAIAQNAIQIASQYHDMGWFTGSLLVAHNGKPILIKSYGYADAKQQYSNSGETRFNLGSIMKHFTKVLVLQQAQQGRINLDDPISTYHLGFPEAIGNKITVRHLLDHSSGFPDIFNAACRENPRKFDSIEKKLKLLLDTELLFEPGSDSRYSNYGYIVLGAILQKVTGISFPVLLKAHILVPAEMTNTTYTADRNSPLQSTMFTFNFDGSRSAIDALEHTSPDGGLESSVSDVLTFYRALYYSDTLLDRQNDENRKQFAMDGEHWGAYGGGAGVSTAVELDLEHQYEIVVLANTDQLVAERISGRILSYIQTGRYDSPRLAAINFAYSAYKTMGEADFLKDFKAHYEDKGYTQFIGRTVNELGMQLVKQQNWSQALFMFDYLVSLFPDAPQVYDSLAYAYHAKGDTHKARSVFAKALAIQNNFKSDYHSTNYQ